MAAANRASLLNAAGNQGAAAGAYTRLLSTEPGSLEDHKAKVLALYASERHEEALESLAIVKRLDPLNAEAWYIEGLCLDALGRFDGAAASLGRFLDSSPITPCVVPARPRPDCCRPRGPGARLL